MTVVTEATTTRELAEAERWRQLRRGGRRMTLRALRASRNWIIVGVLAALGFGASVMVTPLLTRNAVDQGLDPFDQGTLVRYGIAIIVMGAVVAATRALSRYSAFALSLRAETNLRRQMYDHLQALHFGYHDRAQTGQLMARATTDLKQVQTMLIFIPVISANLIMMVSVTAALLLMNVKLTVVALVSLPLMTLATNRFSVRLQPEAAQLQQRLADISGLVEESVTGIRVVKGFGAEPVQNRRLGGLAGAAYDQAMRIARLRAAFTPALEVLPMLGMVGVLYVGGREVIEGRLTVGELLAFNVYILTLIFPLRWLAQAVASVVRGTEAAARVYEVMSVEPEIADRHAPLPLPSGGGALRFEGVDFAYVPGAPVLRGLSFAVEPGETVAIVGQTGCGKSTIARLVPRFYDVTDGRITLDGVDVRDLSLHDLRRSVGLVFEDTFLFTDTIAHNVAFARPDASVDDVVRAAQLAGAHDFVAALANGYDTMLGEGGLTLSGGQRQRIAIARAILADPRVLILDDATSAVDPTKEHEIRAALEEVTAGRTTVIIGHRPATLALADRVLLLDGGRILDEGTHDQLLERSPTYRRVLAQALASDAEEQAAR